MVAARGVRRAETRRIDYKKLEGLKQPVLMVDLRGGARGASGAPTRSGQDAGTAAGGDNAATGPASRGEADPPTRGGVDGRLSGDEPEPENIDGEEENSRYQVELNKFCCNHWLPFHGSVILNSSPSSTGPSATSSINSGLASSEHARSGEAG